MPSVIWYSREQKATEWRVASHLLAKASNGTKIKRSHHKLPISYPDPAYPGFRTYLSHSFIKVGDKVLVMAGEGNYLGAGAFGKVKLAEDLKGNLYALKISLPGEKFFTLEEKITKDVNIFHGRARRIGQLKEVVALSYLGTALDKMVFEKRKSEKVAFLAVDELLKLHKGELSQTGSKYIHADLKLDNLSLAPDRQRVHLLDYGLSVVASNDAFGLRQTHQSTIIDSSYCQYAPETRSSKRELSYRSDIFSLGWALTELLTDDSALQSIAKLMRSNRIALRPSLELVKVAFLAEIYKGSSERLAQMLAEYNCVITDPKLARRALQTISDSSTNFLLIRSINGLTISFHPQALQPEHWQQLLESNHLQQVVIKLIRAEINFKGRWQSILSNSSLQQAIISLESSGGNLTRDLQRLLDDSNLQKAVAVLDKIGISVKKNYRYLLASEDLQQAVILLDKQDINFKGKWQDLLEKPSLQKIISDFGNTSFRLAKNLHDLLENHSFQQAVIILDQSGIDCKRSWNGLLWSTELQQVVIALGQAQVDLKANWQQLLSDPDLRKAVMVLANAGISLGGNWQQLLENASLQKAAAVLDKVGIGLEGNAQELLANSNLQKALAAANDYLSYDFSRLGLSHGHHGKSQTKQFVRHLMAGEDKSECGVKMEMSRWVKGYGTFARSSSTQTLSRLDFACDSGLFPNSSATLFFAMSKVDREAMKQEVVSFSGK